MRKAIICYFVLFLSNTVQAETPHFLTLPTKTQPIFLNSFAAHSGWINNTNTGNGIDYDMKIGTDLVATINGVICEVRDYLPNLPISKDNFSGSYGNYIKMTCQISGVEYMIIYGHISPNCLVKVGDTVRRGQLIGKSGHNGFSTTPHLHFEVRKNGVNIDPYDGDANNLGPNHLWTTNPPSHSAYNLTYFTFPNHSSQGFTCGYDTKTTEQTQADINTWKAATDGINPGVEGPELPKGMDTDQFRFRFSARVDGVGLPNSGYMYLRALNGSWDNEINFGSVYPDREYHVYEVDLSKVGTTLNFDKFSIELTSHGSYQEWYFDWAYFYSLYDSWDFTTNPEGWITENNIKDHGIYEHEWPDKTKTPYWELDPGDNDPQIISPNLGAISASDYKGIRISYSVQPSQFLKREENKHLLFGQVFFSHKDESFTANNSASFDVICDGKQHVYEVVFNYPSTNWTGDIFKIRIDPLVKGTTDSSDVIRIAKIEFIPKDDATFNIATSNTNTDSATTSTSNTSQTEPESGSGSILFPPESLTATYQNGVVKLSWTRGLNPWKYGTLAYLIYRDNVKIDMTGVYYFNDRHTSPNSSYNYKVITCLDGLESAPTYLNLTTTEPEQTTPNDTTSNSTSNTHTDNTNYSEQTSTKTKPRIISEIEIPPGIIGKGLKGKPEHWTKFHFSKTTGTHLFSYATTEEEKVVIYTYDLKTGLLWSRDEFDIRNSQ